MELLAAVILGIIQGLTEFLPISSSAHLILVPWIFGWKPEPLVFDVSLHIGTAMAILAYFWQDWVRLGREALAGIFAGRPFATLECRLAWFLVVGTIPAALAGLLFEDQIETIFRSPLVIVATLSGLGAVLYLAERRGRRQRTISDLSWSDAIWIGLSQALALVPGVSRSGITISTALLRNVDRASAARFSFLLATPVVVGAGLLEMHRLGKALGVYGPDLAAGNAPLVAINWSALAIGVACAAITGFLCIRYFLKYLQTRSFIPFVIYRVALAAIVLWFYLRAS